MYLFSWKTNGFHLYSSQKVQFFVHSPQWSALIGMNFVHTKWEKYHNFVSLNQLSSTVIHPIGIPTHA